ncbi:MAG: RNA polymerase sigma factor [Myxococcota bacterium]
MSTIDRTSFDAWAAEATPKLRGVIRRFVGHPDETEDLVQGTLLRAWESRASFRADSEFSTWLCAIGSRLAIDHLRRQKRWRVRAQVAYGNECGRDPELGGEVQRALAAPDEVFDVREHISYCFSCVGRSLNPDEYGAVVLREIAGLSNREAAKTVGVTESVLRHRLAAGRRVLADAFDDLCSLVNKNGVCYQCQGLREGAANRGPDVPEAALTLDRRLEVVAANPDDGRCQKIHDLFWRRTAELERDGRGSTEENDCGRDGA